MGSTGNYFQGFGCKLIVLGIEGALKKCKQSQPKEKAFISFDFFKFSVSGLGGGGGLPKPPFENQNVFTFMISC